jgi:cell division protein FtsL
MVRLLNVLAVLALIGSAIYAYQIKYATIFNAEEIVKLTHEIAARQDAVAMLRAEWAHLIRPERIQALADKFLTLRQASLNQFVTPEAIPAKPAKTDAIGNKLEALGIAEPTNTPLEGRAAPATPASQRR